MLCAYRDPHRIGGSGGILRRRRLTQGLTNDGHETTAVSHVPTTTFAYVGGKPGVVTFQLPHGLRTSENYPCCGRGNSKEERREERTGKEEGSLERRLGQL